MSFLQLWNYQGLSCVKLPFCFATCFPCCRAGSSQSTAPSRSQWYAECDTPMDIPFASMLFTSSGRLAAITFSTIGKSLGGVAEMFLRACLEIFAGAALHKQPRSGHSHKSSGYMHDNVSVHFITQRSFSVFHVCRTLDATM